MPKTKDAFALRGFDTERILQRPYFKRLFDIFYSENIPDTELLEKMLLSKSQQSAWEVKKFIGFLNRLVLEKLKYDYLLAGHMETLEKLMHYYSDKYVQTSMPIYKEKYNRAFNLKEFYFKVYETLEKIFIEDRVAKILFKSKEVLKSICQKQFGSRLKQAREKAGLTQAQLSFRTGLKTFSPIAQYEQGRREPSITTLFLIATELNCSLDWLLGLN